MDRKHKSYKLKSEFGRHNTLIYFVFCEFTHCVSNLPSVGEKLFGIWNNLRAGISWRRISWLWKISIMIWNYNYHGKGRLFLISHAIKFLSILSWTVTFINYIIGFLTLKKTQKNKKYIYLDWCTTQACVTVVLLFDDG